MLSKYSGNYLIVLCFISKMKFTFHFEMIHSRTLSEPSVFDLLYSRMISVFADEITKKKKALRLPQQLGKLYSLFIIHRFPYLGRARLDRSNVVYFHHRRYSLQS